MKIFIKIFTIFIFYLFFAFSVHAFQFQKSAQNPLPITYTEGYTYHQQVHIYKDNDSYKGIFVIGRLGENYHSLGYFESNDGLSWQMKKTILNSGLDLSNPRILKTQAGYMLFYTRYDSDNIYRIYSSNCDSNFNCSQLATLVLGSTQSNQTENYGVFAAAPFQQNSRTYLFYGAWGSVGFQMKLSYSDDLITWQKCPNDKQVFYGGDGPFPFQIGNELNIFFHHSDSSGIGILKTGLPLSCTSNFENLGYVLTKNQLYDLYHMIFSSIVDDGNLKLYYSGLGSDGSWHLSLANQTGITPTITLTPTLTMTTTPTFSVRKPIIIVPGIFASWNKESIIHNAKTSQANWKMNPIVNEYTGIIKTLKNLGYEENINLFIFNYDWRKPAVEIAVDLHNYISDKIKKNEFDIVGHSLGGLVSRIYAQDYPYDNLRKIITVGSPHFGVALMYKLVEAGEIEAFNNYVGLAAKMILAINKNNLETNKATLTRMFPIFKDLFPVYDFLKKGSQVISVGNMVVKNSTLAEYDSNLSNWANKANLINIVGSVGETLKGFEVDGQTLIDKLLGDYPDGRPLSPLYDAGDNTVLTSSAAINLPETLNLSHNELIYNKEGIKKVLNTLNIQYDESKILEGKPTNLDSSIIVLMKSPAEIEVVHNLQNYKDQEGIIFIANPEDGDYKIMVKGIESGDYELLIGQTGNNIVVWDNIYGTISPNGEDIYNIHYQSFGPVSYFKTTPDVPGLFKELLTYLGKSTANSMQIKKINLIKDKFVSEKNPESLLANFKEVVNEAVRRKDFIALEKIENIEMRLTDKNGKIIDESDINRIEKEIDQLDQPIDQLVLTAIVKRLDIMKKQNDPKNEIYFRSIKELLTIISK